MYLEAETDQHACWARHVPLQGALMGALHNGKSFFPAVWHVRNQAMSIA